MRHHSPGSYLLALLLTAIAPTARAFELIENLQVHGFLTQGYFLTSNHKVFGNSDRGGSLNFTEIGVNGSWELSPKLRIAAQLLSRRAGKAADGSIDLDFGLADYTAVDNENYKLGLRAGRVRLPYGGFWNDARDVAFARPSILLPQSIYSDVIRSLLISVDGVETYSNLYTRWGDFQFQFVGFYPRSNDGELIPALLGLDVNGELQGRPSYFGRLLYDYKGRLKLGISGGHTQFNFTPKVTQDLGSGSTTTAPIIFSAQYNTDRWSFTAEYRRSLLANQGFGNTQRSTIIQQDAINESYYAQAAFRPAYNWEAVVRYDVYYNDESDRDGRRFRANLIDNAGIDIPAHVSFAKDWMVGLRYDISKDFMVRAEYHRVFGTGTLSLLDNPVNISGGAVPVGQDKANWDIFAVLFSYRF